MKWAVVRERILEKVVAPLAGAWIEIQRSVQTEAAHPVAPLAGAWIEIPVSLLAITSALPSLPSRERGLKSGTDDPVLSDSTSLPSRERGLKSFGTGFLAGDQSVAPLAGAWIEIVGSGCTGAIGSGRSPRGSVD